MKKRILGRTGLFVSEFCLGTMNFGWKLDRESSFAILDAFHRAGGNFLQSACFDPGLLAGSQTAFQPEAHVGAWIESRRINRQDLFLSSRLALQRRPGSSIGVGVRIREACEHSLARLGTDYLDLLICEWTPSFLPLDEMLEAMSRLVREGKLRYFGMAGFPAWRVMESINRSVAQNACRVELLESDYSLVRRKPAEPDLLDLCDAYRIGFLVRSPLAGGFLAGSLHTPGSFTAQRRLRLSDRHDNARDRAVLSEVSAIAESRGDLPSQTALAWCLSKPAVTSIVIGTQSEAHLNAAISAANRPLSSTDITRLNAVSSGAPVPVPPVTAKRRSVRRQVLA